MTLITYLNAMLNITIRIDNNIFTNRSSCIDKSMMHHNRPFTQQSMPRNICSTCNQGGKFPPCFTHSIKQTNTQRRVFYKSHSYHKLTCLHITYNIIICSQNRISQNSFTNFSRNIQYTLYDIPCTLCNLNNRLAMPSTSNKNQWFHASIPLIHSSPHLFG